MESAAHSADAGRHRQVKNVPVEVPGQNPPLSAGQTQQLDANYVAKAEVNVQLQLSRAGIRLASLLTKTLGSADTNWNACLAAH